LIQSKDGLTKLARKLIGTFQNSYDGFEVSTNFPDRNFSKFMIELELKIRKL
jgi:hypothetical protein